MAEQNARGQRRDAHPLSPGAPQFGPFPPRLNLRTLPHHPPRGPRIPTHPDQGSPGARTGPGQQGRSQPRVVGSATEDSVNPPTEPPAPLPRDPGSRIGRNGQFAFTTATLPQRGRPQKPGLGGTKGDVLLRPSLLQTSASSVGSRDRPDQFAREAGRKGGPTDLILGEPALPCDVSTAQGEPKDTSSYYAPCVESEAPGVLHQARVSDQRSDVLSSGGGDFHDKRPQRVNEAKDSPRRKGRAAARPPAPPALLRPPPAHLGRVPALRDSEAPLRASAGGFEKRPPPPGLGPPRDPANQPPRRAGPRAPIGRAARGGAGPRPPPQPIGRRAWAAPAPPLAEAR
ncbi:basic salivary proline-rich protein 2-like [Tachyglossus aculeatus]|uniref:basic salivary proline-rich protein 2-like n=1 Tax=Tachyglossus aculeatus TaxID=9261 RepID=UPI0018F36029|nr:basic salivary proline-rich protein 2-like [Tachyglossus aculeatus]